MNRRRFASTGAAVAAMALAFGMVVGGSGAFAQDTGTPESVNGTMSDAAHPAHIHSGTCETLGDVVFPLNDLTADDMGTPGTESEPAGMATAEVDEESTTDAGSEMDGTPSHDASPMDGAADDREVVVKSTTTVTATFDQIFGAEHSINIHESAENISNYIACGDITGDPSAEGQLEIEIQELNDSGLEGRATLTDNGDGTIEVVVELMHVESGDMEDEADATPTA